MDRFIARGYDVLCVNIVDRTAAAVVVDKAQEAGIPLIFFNRQPVDEDIRRGEQVYYVGVDAQGNGALQGQLVLDVWQQEKAALDRNGDGVLQYAMLEGEPGHQDALLRTEYSVKTLTDAGVAVEKLASDTANWNRSQASAGSHSGCRNSAARSKSSSPTMTIWRSAPSTHIKLRASCPCP